jgi:hypothetical protein
VGGATKKAAVAQEPQQEDDTLPSTKVRCGGGVVKCEVVALKNTGLGKRLVLRNTSLVRGSRWVGKGGWASRPVWYGPEAHSLLCCHLTPLIPGAGPTPAQRWVHPLHLPGCRNCCH